MLSFVVLQSGHWIERTQIQSFFISWQLSSLWLGHIWPWRPQLLNINHFPWGSTQCKACIKLIINSDWKEPGYACVNCSWGTVYYEVSLFSMEIPWLLVQVAVYNRLASVDIWNTYNFYQNLFTVHWVQVLGGHGWEVSAAGWPHPAAWTLSNSVINAVWGKLNRFTPNFC